MKTMPRSLDFAAALEISDYNDAKALVASVAETVVVPATAAYVLITTKGDVDLWVIAAGTAAVPGDTADGTASQLLRGPTLLALKGLSRFSVLSETATVVSLAYFSKP